MGPRAPCSVSLASNEDHVRAAGSLRLPGLAERLSGSVEGKGGLPGFPAGRIVLRRWGASRGQGGPLLPETIYACRTLNRAGPPSLFPPN